MSEDDHSVTLMLAKLKGGDEFAAQMVWNRFFKRVCSLAKKKLGSAKTRIQDEEDVALSAIHALFEGAKNDRFASLENRDDLWQILCMITSRKASAVWRKQGSVREVGESFVGSVEAGIEYIASVQPDQGYLNNLSITSKELLDVLEPRLREVAVFKLEGCTAETTKAS